MGAPPPPVGIEPLLGRKKELADVLRLVRVDGARVVTVTGPPGVGKRRFVAAVARELRPDEQVDLAAAAEPRGTLGERSYRLRRLAEAPAVELFRHVAETAAPGFDAPYAAIARACRRIGRLPLAIKLAAARAPAALAEIAHRQWSLPDVIAWTCERLTPEERAVLRAVATDPTAVAVDAAEVEIAALEAVHLIERSEAGVATHPAIGSIAASL